MLDHRECGSLGRGLDHGLTWPLSRVDGISSNDGCVNRFSGLGFPGEEISRYERMK